MRHSGCKLAYGKFQLDKRKQFFFFFYRKDGQAVEGAVQRGFRISIHRSVQDSTGDGPGLCQQLD